MSQRRSEGWPDDDRDSRELLEVMLDHASHEIILASNRRDALRRYDAAGADVAIVDIFMPTTDGLEVIRALRQRPSTLKIIVISAGGTMRHGRDYGVLDDAKQLGADAVVRRRDGWRPTTLTTDRSAETFVLGKTGSVRQLLNGEQCESPYLVTIVASSGLLGSSSEPDGISHDRGSDGCASDVESNRLP